MTYEISMIILVLHRTAIIPSFEIVETTRLHPSMTLLHPILTCNTPSTSHSTKLPLVVAESIRNVLESERIESIVWLVRSERSDRLEKGGRERIR